MQHGVNFAVAGATALDSRFFYEKGIGRIMWTNGSLSVQLEWFKNLKSTLCNTKQGTNILTKNPSIYSMLLLLSSHLAH